MNAPTRVFASFFHTPSGLARRLWNQVLRAGHLRAAPDYRIERRAYPGHDLLLVLKGCGCVRSGGRTFTVQRGAIAWLDCHHPHAHFPAPEDPWELLWIRAQGSQIDAIADAMGVVDAPVFVPASSEEAASVFRRMMALLNARTPGLEAALHAELAQLCAILFRARLRNAGVNSEEENRFPVPVRRALSKMKLYYQRTWSVTELAHIARMSPPHFFRLFRKATGSSPIEWLRRERVSHAQRRLLETAESVALIAEQVGYSDPFYFSRDFKKLVGISPRQFRQQESGRTTARAST